MRHVLALALAAVLACPAAAVAAPCKGAGAVVEGTPAPCDGVLWPATWTAAALRDRKVRLRQCKADAEHAAQVAAAALAACQAEGAHASAVAVADLQAANARADTWRRLADERQAILDGRPPVVPPPPPPPWYAGRTAWGAGGVVVGVVVTAGAVYLAGRLR